MTAAINKTFLFYYPPVKCYSLGRVPPVQKHYYTTLEKVQSAVVVHAAYWLEIYKLWKRGILTLTVMMGQWSQHKNEIQGHGSVLQSMNNAEAQRKKKVLIY
jgi:hypothetical protein